MTMPLPRGPALSPRTGDRAPATYGVTFENSFYSLDAQAGRPAAVILVGGSPFAAAARRLAAFQARASDFATLESDVIALVDMQSPHVRDFGETNSPDIRKVFCEADTFERWGFDVARSDVFILDRASRIVATVDAADPAATDQALDAVRALPREAARDVALPAPLLMTPSVFSAEFCRELIAHFESGAHAFGGMASIDASGRSIHKIDEQKKHRHDLVLGPRDPMLQRVLTGIILRCLPEVRKAFHVDASHTDRILIARYDERGGYFRRHRDNTAPSVAFRQFALSVNLNDDYEGGHLMFPEYNSHRYRPRAGDGIVFSCSLLHEATPVTRGERYVLLTFLHNSEAQAQWLEEAKIHP